MGDIVDAKEQQVESGAPQLENFGGTLFDEEVERDLEQLGESGRGSAKSELRELGCITAFVGVTLDFRAKSLAYPGKAGPHVCDESVFFGGAGAGC